MFADRLRFALCLFFLCRRFLLLGMLFSPLAAQAANLIGLDITPQNPTHNTYM